MYQKGEVQITKPMCDAYREDRVCDCDSSGGYKTHGEFSDSRSEGYKKQQTGTVYLPHSCDEWIIGGRAEVEQLIADLQVILEAK